MALNPFTMLCKLSPPSISRIFSSSPTETLYPFNNSNSLFPLHAAPGNHPSTFCPYEYDYSRYAKKNSSVFLLYSPTTLLTEYFTSDTSGHQMCVWHLVTHRAIPQQSWVSTVRFSSDTVYLWMMSDPTDEGVSPTRRHLPSPISDTNQSLGCYPCQSLCS